MGPFEEGEEATRVASDVVEVEGEDPDTPGHLRGDEAPGSCITIPQYWFNKT